MGSECPSRSLQVKAVPKWESKVSGLVLYILFLGGSDPKVLSYILAQLVVMPSYDSYHKNKRFLLCLLLARVVPNVKQQ